MELVPLPCAVSHHNRMETDILEALQTQGAGHLGVEAAGAKLSVTLLNRAIVHDIVGRDGHTARLAADHAAALLTFVSHVISSDRRWSLYPSHKVSEFNSYVASLEIVALPTL